MHKVKLDLTGITQVEVTVPDNFYPKMGMVGPSYLSITIESNINPDGLRLYGIIEAFGTQYFWAKSPADAYAQLRDPRNNPFKAAIVELPKYPGDTHTLYEFQGETGWSIYKGGPDA